MFYFFIKCSHRTAQNYCCAKQVLIIYSSIWLTIFIFCFLKKLNKKKNNLRVIKVKLLKILTVLLNVFNNVFHQCRNFMAADGLHACNLLQWNAKNSCGAGWAPALVAWQWRHAFPHVLLLLLATTPTRPHVYRHKTKLEGNLVTQI